MRTRAARLASIDLPPIGNESGLARPGRPPARQIRRAPQGRLDRRALGFVNLAFPGRDVDRGWCHAGARIKQLSARVRARGIPALHIFDRLPLVAQGCFVGSEVQIEHGAIRKALPTPGTQDHQTVDMVVDDLTPPERRSDTWSRTRHSGPTGSGSTGSSRAFASGVEDATASWLRSPCPGWLPPRALRTRRHVSKNSSPSRSGGCVASNSFRPS